jgi:hypothetical protein
MSAHERPLTVLIIALVAVACTTAGSNSAQTPTPTPLASAVSAASPPAATALATPGPGESAKLVVRLTSCDDVCSSDPGTTVLADGRVIWMAESPIGRGLFERTLTSSGLETVHDAVDATRLLGAGGSYRPTVKPGKEPPAHGFTSLSFRATHGEAPVIVQAVDPSAFETDFWDIPAQLYVLADLARKLADPEAWLPAGAWADVRRPHAAEMHLLMVTAERFAGDRPPFPDADAVHWPFPFSIDVIGAPYTAEGRIVENSRCLPITRGLTSELAAAERAVGYDRSLTAPYTDLPYAWARGPGSIDVAVRVLLPDQPTTCIGGGAW